MRGICLSKENALFLGTSIALRHMNSPYNKPAQAVASPRPGRRVPEKSRDSRKYAISGVPGLFRAGRSARLLVQACCKRWSCVSARYQKIKRFLLEGICAAYGFESKWVTHLVYVHICVTPVRRVFEGSASISEAHLESFCAPNE